MNKGNPQKPVGTSPMFIFMGWVWDMLVNRLNFIDSSTVKWSRGTKGISAMVKVNAPGSPPTTAAVQWLTFVAVFGTYLVCKDSSGKIIPVAKQQELWNTIGYKTIYGNLFSYGYPHDPAGGGPASDQYSYIMRSVVYFPPGSSQQVTIKQLITPPYIVQGNMAINGKAAASLIPAIAVTDGTNLTLDPKDNITPAGTKITMLDVSHRAWAKSADQTI